MIDARQHVTSPRGSAKHPNAVVVGIAVHHSVSGDYLGEAATVNDELAHLRGIDAYHRQVGYGMFGYHLAAFASGRLYQCGDLDGQRAHVAHRNHELRGVVAIGTFTNRLPGPGQLAAIAEGIKEIRHFVGRDLPIKGHNEWAVKGWASACAGQLNGFDWRPWLDEKEPEQEDETVSNPVWAEWRDRPEETPYRSYLLFATPSGMKKRLVQSSEEHNTLLATKLAGDRPLPLSLAVLNQFEGSPAPDER